MKEVIVIMPNMRFRFILEIIDKDVYSVEVVNYISELVPCSIKGY